MTISEPGSYRLSGNLVLPNRSTTAIEITASDVTVDLNGFAILAPECPGPPCSSFTTHGIATGSGTTPRFNITIRNGTFRHMAGDGVALSGNAHVVEYLHVRNSGASGISIVEGESGGSSIVQHSTLQANGAFGVRLLRGAVRNNVVSGNGSTGIAVSEGSVAHNVATGNLAGIVMSPNGGAGAFGNVLRDNSAGNLVNGANLGQNLCTGSGGLC